jgi:hypothetical protein
MTSSLCIWERMVVSGALFPCVELRAKVGEAANRAPSRARVPTAPHEPKALANTYHYLYSEERSHHLAAHSLARTASR